MPLAPEHVARVGEFIADYAAMPRALLAQKYGVGRTQASLEKSVSEAASVLRKMGLPLSKKSTAFRRRRSALLNSWEDDEMSTA